VSLENPDNRQFAYEDPRGFLEMYARGAVLDEIQHAPLLFSYLQQILDESSQPGRFILTGSNNFMLQESISQSLAGRIAYQILLPFSYHEIRSLPGISLQEIMFRGSYPPVWDQPVDPGTWMTNYISTYIERDVRQIKNISNLITFERFLKLCAGRVGQILNRNNLAVETGIDNKTVDAWISILESSFIIYRLKPYFRNFNKRIIKSPKLYFYDTGLAASLLGIHESSQLNNHPLTGSLFENYITGEILKIQHHYSKPFDLYYWRDSTGHEIDILSEGSFGLLPIEIKAGKTITSDYFKNLTFFQQLSNTKQAAVIYTGNNMQQRSNGITVIPWDRIHTNLKQLKT